MTDNSIWSDDWEPGEDWSGGGSRSKRLPRGDDLGASVYELAPGERSFPYHYEYPCEEWLLVISGAPTLRAPDGEHALRAGDVVCFRQGPEGAHLVRNDTDEPVRVLITSTKSDVAVAVYPDSDKVGVWTGNDADPPFLVRPESAVDYWDGETP